MEKYDEDYELALEYEYEHMKNDFMVDLLINRYDDRD